MAGLERPEKQLAEGLGIPTVTFRTRTGDDKACTSRKPSICFDAE